MEQQKILWIILSVAVLLLAVLGSALFVFRPSSADNGSATIVKDTTSGINNFDPIEWARTGSEYPTLNDITPADNEGTFVVVDGNTNSGKEGVHVPGSETVVSLPVKKAEQPKIPAVASSSPKTDIKNTDIKKTDKTEKTDVKKTEPAKAPVKTAGSGIKSSAPKGVKEYWIQTNSFSTIARAEEERRVITAKGFPAVIQAKADGDKTFYRVRVGSYSTKAEAEKFLYWIKDIKGLEGSQIYEVMAKREL